MCFFVMCLMSSRRETDVSLAEIIISICVIYRNIVSSNKLPLALNDVVGHTSETGSQVCPEKSNTTLNCLFIPKQFHELIYKPVVMPS